MLLQKKQKRQVVITGQKRKHHETFVLGGYQKLISTIMPKIAHRLKNKVRVNWNWLFAIYPLTCS